MIWRLVCFAMVALSCSWLAAPAQAQLVSGAARLSLDTDIFSAGVVKQEPKGPATQTKTTVISAGPNLLGSSRAVIATPSVGITFGYVLKPKWMLGLRTGVGYDRVAVDGAADEKTLALSFMPELTFVPTGDAFKPFLRFSPLAQYNRTKQGSTKDQIFMGCFSAGVGAMWFSSKWSSIDAGAYFEGRFGNLEQEPSGEIDVDDLRGVIRVGLSLWR